MASFVNLLTRSFTGTAGPGLHNGIAASGPHDEPTDNSEGHVKAAKISTPPSIAVGSIGNLASSTPKQRGRGAENSWSTVRSTELSVSLASMAGSMGGAKLDSRYMLDSRAALKAFRLIGGYDGIEIGEFRVAAEKVRDDQVRIPLLKNLGDLFAQFDSDEDGVLNALEFEVLLQSSTLLQRAVYELLERSEEEEFHGHSPDDLDNVAQYRDNTLRCVDMISVALVISNIVVLGIQIDVSPDWLGWHILEIVFVSLFSIEFAVRFCLWIDRGKHKSFAENCAGFFRAPLTLIDMSVVILGWTDVGATLSDLDSNSNPLTNLRWVCLLRMARCARLFRILWHCEDLRVFLAGLMSGVRSSIWGLATIVMIIFLWAVFIRTAIVNEWGDAHQSELPRAFPSMPDCMLLVFRCMATSADGACGATKNHGPIFPMLSDEFGWVFNMAWLLSELFIMIGILNVVASVFVTQATENVLHIRQSISSADFIKDQIRLQQLDKLMRTLIHPGRETCNPKDRNAAEVARMIRTEHPEAAAQIPDLETQIVHFAQGIQEAKKNHQDAMNVYEAKEVGECKQLRTIPCAKTYVVDGREVLLVDDDASMCNSLMLPMAPMGAVEVMMFQELDTAELLLEEAVAAQSLVKSLILPNSDWAAKIGSGCSGPIWRHSRGLCDEALDPGIKSLERIDKKVQVKYKGRYDRNRDYARLALVYESVSHLIQAVPKFLEFNLETHSVQVMSLENRFLHPHPLGWRDVTMLLKVRTASDRRPHGVSHHIMEMQLRLKGLTEVCHEGHKFYEDIRANLPDVLMTTILDRLVTDTTLDLGITKSEWLQCLPNREVRKLLDALGIPRRSRKTLFDIMDIDGSGTVTSSELQETIRLFKAPVSAHELVGCHFRVRDIQRQLQTKMEPQLSLMHNYAVRCMATHEMLAEALLAKIDETTRIIASGASGNATRMMQSSTFSESGELVHEPTELQTTSQVVSMTRDASVLRTNGLHSPRESATTTGSLGGDLEKVPVLGKKRWLPPQEPGESNYQCANTQAQDLLGELEKMSLLGKKGLPPPQEPGETSYQCANTKAQDLLGELEKMSVLGKKGLPPPQKPPPIHQELVPSVSDCSTTCSLEPSPLDRSAARRC